MKKPAADDDAEAESVSGEREKEEGDADEKEGGVAEKAADAAEKVGEAAEAAAEKAQEVLSRYSDKIEMLEKHQVPIGIACIVLGFLHLVIGGIVLF